MLNTLLDGIPGALDPLPSSMRVHCAEVVEPWPWARQSSFSTTEGSLDQGLALMTI